jgi:CBS domain-containing protein
MKTVRNILAAKGVQVWSVTPTTPVFEALKLMAEKDIGALVVLQGDKIAGIFTERDYARKIVLLGKASRNTPVSEIMTAPVVTVGPKQSAMECLALMSRERIRYLPVVEQGQLAGMISIGDVVNAIIADQEDALQRLERAAQGDAGLLS